MSTQEVGEKNWGRIVGNSGVRWHALVMGHKKSYLGPTFTNKSELQQLQQASAEWFERLSQVGRSLILAYFVSSLILKRPFGKSVPLSLLKTSISYINKIDSELFLLIK